MQAQFPSVAVGLHHFGLARQIVVGAVRHVALAHEGLEIAAELHAIGRVDVDHLHLAGHVLVLQKRVHHHQTITQNHAVEPAVGVFIGLEQLLGHVAVRVSKKVQCHLPAGLETLEAFQNGLGRQALVDEQGQRRHFEAQPLSLAGPFQKRP